MAAAGSLEMLTRETRRKVRRAYYADGLFDLILGLGIVWVSWLALIGQIVFWYLPLVLMVAGLPAAKKRWVQPRTGYVKPGRPARGRSGPVWSLAALLAAIVALGLWHYREQAQALQLAYSGIGWVVEHVGLLLGLVGGGAMLWNGYALGIPRLAGYGLGLALAGALSAWSRIGLAFCPHLPESGLCDAAFFGLLGLAMAVAGAALFVRYLRQHPARREEV